MERGLLVPLPWIRGWPAKQQRELLGGAMAAGVVEEGPGEDSVPYWGVRLPVKAGVHHHTRILAGVRIPMAPTAEVEVEVGRVAGGKNVEMAMVPLQTLILGAMADGNSGENLLPAEIRHRLLNRDRLKVTNLQVRRPPNNLNRKSGVGIGIREATLPNPQLRQPPLHPHRPPRLPRLQATRSMRQAGQIIVLCNLQISGLNS